MAARRTKTTKKSRSRVKYAEANRVRSLLLSEDVQMLSRRDVQTLVHILNDTYPSRYSSPHSVWQPLLIGIGLGIIVILGVVSI